MIHLSLLTRHSLFLVLLFLAVSCMDDDLSDCPPLPPPVHETDTRIQFGYVSFSGDNTEGFDASELESITVFAFDSLGRFYGQVTDAAPRLADPLYSVSLPLLPGRYDFYAWGNVRDCYAFTSSDLIKEQTQASEIGLNYARPSNDTVRVHPHPLFFGSLKNAEVILPTRADTTYLTLLLPLVKNTYNIDFELLGLDEDRSLELVVTDNNASYGFDNSFWNSDYLHHAASAQWESSSALHRASITTLRLERNRSPRLKLYNSATGHLIYHNDLIDLLLAAEETSGKRIDFSRQHNFKVALAFSEEEKTGNISLTITVNGWHVVRQNVTVDLSKPNLPH